MLYITKGQLVIDPINKSIVIVKEKALFVKEVGNQNDIITESIRVDYNERMSINHFGAIKFW